jgi:lipopolysaccharide/colanic/teichoic acid biosynthesis glycosyltransferase
MQRVRIMLKSGNDLIARDEVAAVSESAFSHFAKSPRSQHEVSLIRSARNPQIGWPERVDSKSARAGNFAIALLLIVLLAPVLLLVSLLIMASDRGPVLFRHQRVGKDGKSFACLKFRTMRVDSEVILQRLLNECRERQHEWLKTRKLEDDPRVTRLGKVLRITSLDELPQLFNVAAGHMNMVGPRPIVHEELAYYGRYVGHYLSVKPGLTGIWQVSGRSLLSYRRRVAADVLYVRRRSFALDLYIALATVPAVIFARGSI